MACSVVVAVGDIADPLVHKLKEAASQLKIGNGLEQDVFLGPVIRSSHKDRTIDYIEAGIREGASLIVDGRNATATQESGYFLGPTIFDGVQTDMKIWQDEIFAPVLSIIRASSLREAIEITNRSEFANGACLYTDSAKAIRQFREQIDAGCWVSTSECLRRWLSSHSRVSKVFYGDLHANGRDGVEFYTRKKMVTSRY